MNNAQTNTTDRVIAMDQEDQILVELSNMDDLLLPLSRSARLKYNCMSVSTRFIALGSNTGGIYLFSRETCNFLQVVFAEKETSPVTMASLSPNDRYVAMVSSSGVLYVIDLKLESRAKPETMRSTSDWNGTLTYIHWDIGCTRLYYGDSMGGVYEMTVHSSKAKNLFTLPPESILKLDSSIVQIDKAGEKLLVSTLTRCYLCDTGKQQFSTIGKKLRDGHFGACFLCQGSSPTIYCARPGSRMWEVDIEGEVMNTHQFKQLLAIPPLPAVKLKESFQLPNRDAKFNPQSLNFPRLKIISGSYILTWTDSSLYILDPVNIKVVLWSQPFTGIQDVYCLNNEIYLFLASMQVHCLSLLPVSRVTSLCYKSESFISAASLCIHFENSFCLKRKAQFDIGSIKRLYDELVEAKMEELAENLHSVIANIEQKLAAFSDSESTGSNKSRTNSFTEQNTAEKITNHNIANASIASLSNVNGKDLDGSLELFVNQNSTVTATDTVIQVTNLTHATSDVITEIETPDLVVISNSDEFDDDKSVNYAKADTVVQGHGKDQNSIIFQNTIAEKMPICKNSVQSEESQKQENNLVNNISNTQQLEKDVKLISDVVDNKRIGVSEEINELQNHVGNTQIHVGSENKDLVNTAIAIGSNATDTKTDTVNINGDDSCMCKETENSIKNMIQSKTGEGVSGTDIADSENIATMQKESVTGETVINVPANDDLSSKVLETTCNHVSLRDADHIKSQLENATKTHHHENSANKGKDMLAIYDHQAARSKSPVFAEHFPVRAKSPAVAEHSPVRSKSPAPSVSSQKSNSSRKSGDLDDILEDDLDLIQSRSNTMGSRRLSLTSLSSLSSAEVVLEQVAGNDTEEIAVPVKRKSSKRRQRKSLEGSGEVKKKGVKINRSLSLGAVQPLKGKDFSISPQGSLDQAIEEDCFTSVSLQSDKTQQQPVSQSVPAHAEEHSRSLPNIEGFENEAQRVPILDLRPRDDNTAYDSFLSQSAEFSKSGEWSRSGEFSESSLVRSFDGAREGLSSSPKTAFKHLKDRVQKNLKTQTKKVITNIKDKNLLSRAKEFLSQPIDILEHQRSEFSIQSLEYDVQPPNADETKLDQTDSIPKCPVDITTLQEITAETQNKLEDPSVLLDPDSVYKIMLDWVTVLNKTFQQLHILKYTHSAHTHSEAVSGDPGELEVNKIVNNSKTTKTENSYKYYGAEKLGRFSEEKLVDHTKGANMFADSSKPPMPGASILNDKDFCYTKDPLFLPADVFSNVSELAQACFDIGCHGNILQYKDLQVSQNKDKEEPSKDSKVFKEYVSEVSDTLTHNINIGTIQIQGQSSEGAQHSKGQGCQYEQDSLPCREQDNLPNSASKDNCDTNVENENYAKLIESDLMCSDNKESASIANKHIDADRDGSELTDKDFIGVVHKFNITENKSDLPCSENKVEVKGEGHCHSNCNQGDEIIDEETSFFVRCYFPYLSAIKIRNKTKEHGKNWYQTWSALVSCLIELAYEDNHRFGVDKESLLQHVLESLSPGEDGYSLLGHVSKLFTVKSSNVVAACAKCHPYVQPLDVLRLCKLHGVAMETTFKAYMQQLIQDATRTHRKDTIPVLYSHPEVKNAWLEILLAEEGNTHEMMDNTGNPCAMSHCHIWRNQPAIDTIVSKTDKANDRNMVLELCSKYGYWNGCLKTLKDLGERQKQLELILHLDDIRLFNARSSVGYLPTNRDEWKELLQAYKNHSSRRHTEAGNQLFFMPSSDWSDRITWDSLANLLVRHLGPSQAVTLLQEVDIPESSLSASFYQTCTMAGLVHRHQRLVLHSMLEKIDTYLWAQRPVYSSPQLHYIIVKERELQGKGTNSAQQEHLQKLIEQMKSDSNEGQGHHYVEDPDCHWGVETKINLLCPCCNIPLKEAVSHVEPGVLLFKCGHGYHRMCLPERDCFLCLEDAAAYTVQKAYI